MEKAGAKEVLGGRRVFVSTLASTSNGWETSPFASNDLPMHYPSTTRFTQYKQVKPRKPLPGAALAAAVAAAVWRGRIFGHEQQRCSAHAAMYVQIKPRDATV